MPDEVERNVPETPATHKKSAQRYMLILAAILVLVMVADMFRKVGKDENPPPTPAQQTARSTTRGPVVQTFEDRMKREQRRLQTADPAMEKEAPAQTLDRLRQQRDRSAQQAQAYKSFNLDAPKAPTKSPEEVWREAERKRVLESRKAGFDLNLAAQPANPHSQRTVSRNDFMGSLGDSSGRGSSVAQQKEMVSQEMERVGKLKHGIVSGEINPHNLYAAPGQPQGSFAETSRSAPEVQVGQPVSREEGPLPGQLLLPTATVVSAVLDQDLVSDYTGSWRGMVTQDVYDASQEFILIPKGSRVAGKSLRIQNLNEPIQACMGLTVNWVILPNGKRISFEKTGALDQAGVAAFKDKVNYHFVAQFLGVAAYAVLSSESSRAGSGYNADQTFEGEMGLAARKQFAPLAAKYLNLVPTITLRAGMPMRIFIEDDLYVKPWSKVGSSLIPAY